ncbi:hypothetical protein ACRZ9O_10420 [Aquirufa sp. HETE-40SA]
MKEDSKDILLKELEDEYLKQFPNSERPSNSLFDIGIDGIIEGLQNRNEKKIRIVHRRGVCDGGRIVYYTPNKN